MSELLTLPFGYAAPRIGTRWATRMAAFTTAAAIGFTIICLVA